MIIADTGFFFALGNRRDSYHERSLSTFWIALLNHSSQPIPFLLAEECLDCNDLLDLLPSLPLEQGEDALADWKKRRCLKSLLGELYRLNQGDLTPLIKSRISRDRTLNHLLHQSLPSKQ